MFAQVVLPVDPSSPVLILSPELWTPLLSVLLAFGVVDTSTDAEHFAYRTKYDSTHGTYGADTPVVNGHETKRIMARREGTSA
jgi:hypothetical protein